MSIEELRFHAGKKYFDEQRAVQKAAELNTLYAVELEILHCIFAIALIANIPFEDLADVNEVITQRRAENIKSKQDHQFRAFLNLNRYLEQQKGMLLQQTPGIVARAFEVVLNSR